MSAKPRLPETVTKIQYETLLTKMVDDRVHQLDLIDKNTQLEAENKRLKLENEKLKKNSRGTTSTSGYTKVELKSQ